MNPKRILVTGAGGFTGKHFLKSSVALGYECIALSQRGTGSLANAVNVIECGVCQTSCRDHITLHLQL
jgi:uncharacterized protein YbjT (DUF2867 family)